MMIASSPYLLNPSGVGGVYAATVASQPVQPVDAVPGQANGSFIRFGGALAGQDSQGGASNASSSQSATYTPGSQFNIMA